MKNGYIAFSMFLSIALCSCTSFSENIKANKEKFIQVGVENSQPVDHNNFESIYTTAQVNNTEAKMKVLNVEGVETLYTDSVVLFVKENEVAVYDFAHNEQEMASIGKKLKLAHIEKIDQRLFFGKR